MHSCDFSDILLHSCSTATTFYSQAFKITWVVIKRRRRPCNRHPSMVPTVTSHLIFWPLNAVCFWPPFHFHLLSYLCPLYRRTLCCVYIRLVPLLLCPLDIITGIYFGLSCEEFIPLLKLKNEQDGNTVAVHSFYMQRYVGIVQCPYFIAFAFLF